MPKIEEIWAWVSIDKDENDEGVIGWNMGGSWMPLIGADKFRIDSLRGFAKKTATITGKPVKLVKFTTRVEMEVVKP